MKQRIFLSLIAVVLFASANAQEEKALYVNAGHFQHLNIADNMKIMLTPAPFGENTVKIDKEAADKLKLTLSEGALQISSQKALKENVVVYVFVNDLRTLNVGENVLIQTNGILNSAHLDIFIRSNSKAYLKSTGKIDAFPSGENDVIVEPMLTNLKKTK